MVIADSVNVFYVWEGPHYPQYYLPIDDVREGVLEATSTVTHSPSRGDATHFTVHGGGTPAVDAAWTYDNSPIAELRGRVRFNWGAMESWFEEDEEVFVHPRDPYTRIDILRSSQYVKVEVGGVAIAETTRPTFLYETKLPRRTYIPKVDVRMDLLVPTDTATMCPYKGTARYWTVRTPAGDEVDLAWSYPAPFRESAPIAGLVAFWDHRVTLTSSLTHEQ